MRFEPGKIILTILDKVLNLAKDSRESQFLIFFLVAYDQFFNPTQL
ncbi:hypothetical protein SAMN05444360_12222 [Chryseobacterium carnipullorum]|nr:hypothetical protein SAMN05444360_12222 [Chryseobacterium carnipullorum]